MKEMKWTVYRLAMVSTALLSSIVMTARADWAFSAQPNSYPYDFGPSAIVPKWREVKAGEWTFNYEGALAKAKAEGRYTLLLFAGQWWCPHCQALERDVLLTDGFKNYVNDAIGFQLTPEQALVYSENCFGWADAISFSENKHLLRIHDLKTGLTPASMKQLEIYAALFCLEYKKRPGEIDIELAIYQTAVDEDGYYADIDVSQPDPSVIAHHMDQIITLDKWLKKFKGEYHE